MMGYWAAFAKTGAIWHLTWRLLHVVHWLYGLNAFDLVSLGAFTGDPNGAGRPTWPGFIASGSRATLADSRGNSALPPAAALQQTQTQLLVDGDADGAAVGPVADMHASDCKFWSTAFSDEEHDQEK